MNKKLIALLAAALLLVAATATACKDDGKTNGNETSDTNSNQETSDPAGTTAAATDTNGDPVTNPTETSKDPEVTSGFNAAEDNAKFTDLNSTVIVFEDDVRIRNATNKLDNSTVVGKADKDDEFTATGESELWYRITYKINDKDTVAYISKSVACDKDKLDDFTAVNDKVVVKTTSAWVRSFPSLVGDYNKIGNLAKDAEVVRVAKNDAWSIILYKDARCYIANSVIEQVEGSETPVETTGSTETTAPETTDTAESTADTTADTAATTTN